MAFFFFVLCVQLFVGHAVYATQQDTTTDRDALQPIQHLKGQLAKLEQRLEDQNNRLLKQQMTIQELNDRIMKQERTMEQQKHELAQEKTKSAHRFTKQEKTLHMLDRKYNLLITWYRPRVQNKPFSADSRQEKVLPFLNGNQAGLSKTDGRKRSDDAGALEVVLNHVTQQITEMTSDIQALKIANTQQDQARGTSYTRWGNRNCPSSAELVYTGIIGGTHHRSTGGAANHLCLTSHPVLDGHRQPSGNGYAYVYGSEYGICPEPECNTTPACAVCRVSRAASVMIPGTNVCSSGWTKEYSGYIMANYHGYTGSSEFICVDSAHDHHSETTQSEDDENIIYYTHVKCGALPCPPYIDEKIVTCVVCTK